MYGQYACRIVGSILFHSVPYQKQDKSTLEWWEYDKLGTKASLGCIRLTVEDAKWIFDNCVSGTNVEFYTSSNPGPLGKPTAQKITEDEEVRNWDPTDPDSNNPWKTYTREDKEETNTQETSANANETTDANLNASNENKNENKNESSNKTNTNETNKTNTNNNNNTNNTNANVNANNKKVTSGNNN